MIVGEDGLQTRQYRKNSREAIRKIELTLHVYRCGSSIPVFWIFEVQKDQMM